MHPASSDAGMVVTGDNVKSCTLEVTREDRKVPNPIIERIKVENNINNPRIEISQFILNFMYYSY
jgi:hypothetical protein